MHSALERKGREGERGRGGALLVGVIGFKFLLQAQQLLVALVEAPRQRYHYVTLLHQQRLVPVHLRRSHKLNGISLVHLLQGVTDCDNYGQALHQLFV